MPTLLQFVLLSMLLHVLFVLLFGSTVNGGARRGEGLLGALSVTLRQLSPEIGSGFTLAPGAETNVPGAALFRRLESPVTLPPRNVAPASAKQEPPSAPAEAAPAVPEAAISPRPPPVEPLRRLDLSAPVEVDKPIFVPAPSSPTIPPPAIAPPAIAPPAIAPPVIATPVISPPKPEREVVAPVAAPPREIVLPEVAPLERLVPAKIEHPVVPTMELPPREVPVETSAPPVRATPALEREAMPAAHPVPRAEAAETAPGRERAAPAAVTPGKAATTPTPARTEAGVGGELPRLRFGAPNVDEDVFRSRRDVVAPPTDTEAAPAVTAESMRKRAGEIAREGSGSRGVLNLVPPPPPLERKDALAEGIAKAAKPDCRTAYAGMGLLAIAPLVASTVGNGGCNW